MITFYKHAQIQIAAGRSNWYICYNWFSVVTRKPCQPVDEHNYSGLPLAALFQINQPPFLPTGSLSAKVNTTFQTKMLLVSSQLMLLLFNRLIINLIAIVCPQPGYSDLVAEPHPVADCFSVKTFRAVDSSVSFVVVSAGRFGFRQLEMAQLECGCPNPISGHPSKTLASWRMATAANVSKDQNKTLNFLSEST